MVQRIQGWYYELAFAVAPRHSFVNTTLELLVTKANFLCPNLQGSIEKTVNTKVAGSTYTITGIIEVVDNTLRITELPIHRWTNDYKEFLDGLCSDKQNKDKVSFIEVVDNRRHLRLRS